MINFFILVMGLCLQNGAFDFWVMEFSRRMKQNVSNQRAGNVSDEARNTRLKAKCPTGPFASRLFDGSEATDSVASKRVLVILER